MFCLVTLKPLLNEKRYIPCACLIGSLLITNACGELKNVEKKFAPNGTKSRPQQESLSSIAAPVFSPIGATYTSTQNVSLASATAGAKIYFTTDGSNPTTSSTLYSSPIAITTTSTLKAIAATDNLGSSEIKSEHYEINTADIGPNSINPVDPISVGEPSHLSQGRRKITVVNVGSKTLFAGGIRYSDTDPDPNAYVLSDVVDIYDASTNTWSTAKLSLGRADMIAINVGSKAIFVGNHWDNVDDVVDIYDASANTWSTASLSQARNHISVVTAGNKVFFAGGRVHEFDSNVIDIYDASSNTWSKATLSQARFSISSVSVGSKVIFAGGDIHAEQGKIGVRGSTVIDIYDVSSDVWSQASLSKDNNGAVGAVTVGTKALFMGCTGGCPCYNRYSEVADLYDLSSNSWTPIKPPPNVADIFNDKTKTWSKKRFDSPRVYSAVTAVNSKALFAGDCNWDKQRYDIDVFDVVSNSMEKTTLPFVDAWSTVDVNKVTTFGSKAIFTKTNTYTPGSILYIYDGETQKWIAVRYPRGDSQPDHVVIINGNKVFLAGGSDFVVVDYNKPTGKFVDLDTVDIYDLDANKWN